jgi:hypothetical protein
VTNEEFFQLFLASAWRLEALPAYGTAESDPAFAGWLERGHLPPLAKRPAKQAWMAAVRAAVAGGKRLGRVHVLRQPLTPYLAYELQTYPENVEAGEDVRIADLDEHPELARFDRDFWLLDDQLVLLMDYDPETYFFRGLIPTRDPAVLADCRHRRDLAVACSVPLAEYLTAVG